MNLFPYREVFKAVEKEIKAPDARHSAEEKLTYLEQFKRLEDCNFSDDDYFSKLVFVTFYSGFKAASVNKRKEVIKEHFPGWERVSRYGPSAIRKIMSDPRMIRNERKIKACVDNAKAIKKIIYDHGSMRNYIDSHVPHDSFENLLLLKETLEATFSYLGGVTSYHFMTDIGLPVLKPDRVICRIFKRLKLIDNEKQLLKSVIIGRKFAEATSLPIRYIDIVLVAYGQEREDESVLIRGICLNKSPLCHQCTITKHCEYEAKTA